MAKSRESKPEEFFKSQIRNLKKELKKANQTIRNLEKDLGYNQNRTPKEKVLKEIEPDCPECSKGFLEQVEFLNRTFDCCNLCGYRSRAIIKKAYKRKK